MKGMVELPGGSFLMGSERFYPEEAPVHPVTVDPFWIDEHQVTVAEFRRFVKATAYVTVAERAPEPEQFPDADPDLLVPGGLAGVRSHTWARRSAATSRTGGRCLRRGVASSEGPEARSTGGPIIP